MSRIIALAIKLFLFCVILLFSWFLIKAGHLETILSILMPFKYLAAIATGVLYTSILTAPLSIAGFYVLRDNIDPITLAALGGIGAVLGDILILKFIRSLFSNFPRVGKRGFIKAINKSLKGTFLQPLLIIVGVIFIALPLPDEIGLLMIGASKLSDTKLVIISYILNSLGIYFILLPFQLLK
jgi:hypothetical protein